MGEIENGKSWKRGKLENNFHYIIAVHRTLSIRNEGKLNEKKS